MSGFTLDTAGAVHGVVASDGDLAAYLWPDLSPFMQGYVEALLRATGSAFSDLSPEALALILRDCEANREALAAIGIHGPGTAQSGADFWRLRNTCKMTTFPPLVPFLADDGRVHLREAAHIDPRDPHPTRQGIFRDHNCWRCDSGAKPCVRGATNRCEYPHARND